MSEKTIETTTAQISWDERGFIKVVFKPRTQLKIEEAKQIHQARLTLSPTSRHKAFFDMRNVLDVSRESRLYGVHEEAIAVTIAIAILVESPVSRLLGNFLVRMSNPSFPVKIFDAETKATDWLVNLKE